MEKIKIGLEMATNWSDPPIVLMGLIPSLIGWIGATGYYVRSGLSAVVGLDGGLAATSLAFALLPTVVVWLLWCGLYHGFFAEKGVDTTPFITFKSKSLAATYKNRKIPMCELYEHYITGEVDWNVACEGGDCYLILERHRAEFVNYKVTARQVFWLLSQFAPKWMTGSGLGQGSSSGKSIEETTKEIDEHYNKGNDVFSCIMGKAMVYTSGVFHSIPEFASSGHRGDYAASAADGTLEVAQKNKMDMICNKIQLKKNETFLDIGCGWGTLARHAVSDFGAKATGVTLSKEGKIYCDIAAAETKVKTAIHCCDYREIPGGQKFDKIASIEMAEHVGIANFVDPYLKTVRALLAKPDSTFMLQVAGLRQGSNWQDIAWGLFMSKYIFPGADASTPLNWYIKQCEKAGFEVHSVETIGRHYSHTLHKWYDNWMSHKEDILTGKIQAISDHSTGNHLFRLNEFFLAWSVIAAGQGSAACYQILCHPNEDNYPRDQWVDARHVSGKGLVGVGLNKEGLAESKKKSQ